MGEFRETIKSKLKQKIANGEIILGAGAGIGLSAKAVDGIVDVIVIYNSGKYRMAGTGSLAGMLPFGDANQIVLDMAREVLPLAKKTPVIAGVCGTDPFRQMDVFLDELKRLKFAGVQNYPTVGLIDGNFRQNLEETGFGYACEIAMIEKASKMGFLTCPYVFDEEQARAMTKAGADIIVAHMGLTIGGTIGAKTALTLEEAAKKVQAIADAVHALNKDIIVVCHGGPISEPKDFDYIRKHTKNINGFWGASSMERLPTEKAIAAQAHAFKQQSSAQSSQTHFYSPLRAKL